MLSRMKLRESSFIFVMFPARLQSMDFIVVVLVVVLVLDLVLVRRPR